MNSFVAKRKIAIVTPYGGEPRLDNYAEFVLAQGLLEKGYDVRFYTYASRHIPTYSQNLIYKGVPVFRVRERFGFSPSLFLSILTFRPDTVLTFHPRSFLNFSAYWASRMVRARFIVEIVGILHDPYIVGDTDDPEGTIKSPTKISTSLNTLVREAQSGAWKNAWENYIFHMPTANADTIIAINENERHHIQSIYKRDAALIYWCAPKLQHTGEMRPQPLSGGNMPAQFLLFIGMVKRRKGWDTAIEALSFLKHRGVIKKLVFVSSHTDLSEPIAHAEALGVRDQITFLSQISNEEKSWVYRNCQYVLIPSRYEGFGLPVFEAFLARKPICASDIPVFREFLVDKGNATIFPKGDAAALAEAVLQLDQDTKLRETLTEGGTATAARFNAEEMIKKYVSLLA